ncbi:MAG: BolA family transcriptional regulator [Woeseiaceae bacterium]|jgi:BolA protein
MKADRVSRIESLLTEAFAPTRLQIKDQSHLHAGHAGAQDGKGHYDVRIVAAAFAGKRPLARHRMVYEALGTMMETDIHALRIDASAPPADN